MKSRIDVLRYLLEKVCGRAIDLFMTGEAAGGLDKELLRERDGLTLGVMKSARAL